MSRAKEGVARFLGTSQVKEEDVMAEKEKEAVARKPSPRVMKTEIVTPEEK